MGDEVKESFGKQKRLWKGEKMERKGRKTPLILSF